MKKAKSFEEDGLGFLISFAKKTKGPWPAEYCTLEAQSKGIAPKDMRHWGTLFQQAAKDGYIRRVPVPFQREMGHGSLTLGWVAC